MPVPLEGREVVEESWVFTIAVNYFKKVGIKDRGQKGNELLKRDKEVKQQAS